MGTMTIDTWVSLAALLGVLVALGGLTIGQTRSLRSDLKGDVARLEAKVDDHRSESKADIAGLRDELKADLAETRSELKADLAAVRSELKADLAAVRSELKADLAETRSELKAEIGRLDDRVYALAAGLRPRIEGAPSAASGE
ncbi:hypothetical protein [Nocardioides sp. YIM 152315]|uniref:hypothetical protein n=1 Tax=Nocardioides sp. YIM 152315 TaxID=3031760 RepID=UPI0023DA0406|nr:hypothetical protein [Nocardioides sp. YIM 152315]MDF1603923.1 hypothetical protein [Nocardioides sp. YIM 152315]